MTTAQAAARAKENPGRMVPCPRCDVNPVPDRGDATPLCSGCRVDEASGGAADAAQARATETPAQEPPAPPPPARAVTKAPASATTAPAPTKRMSVANARSGAAIAPYRVVLYGIGGVGKSTWGAEAPAAIFLPVELSTNVACAKLDQPFSYADLCDGLISLGTERHDYRTVVLDTADAAEPLVWDAVIADDNERSSKGKRSRTIEDVGGGYMKGYVAALQKWRRVLSMLERLQAARGMNVIILAHAQVKTFKNPEGDDYDRWQMKVHDKLGALLIEWSEAALFANYSTTVEKDRRGRSLRKGIGGNRVIHTERKPAFDAKNRYGLPPELPLGWAEFDAAVQASRTPEALRALIAEKVAALGDAQVAAWVESKIGDAPTSLLSRIHNQLALRLEEKERATEEGAADAGGGSG